MNKVLTDAGITGPTNILGADLNRAVGSQVYAEDHTYFLDADGTMTDMSLGEPMPEQPSVEE